MSHAAAILPHHLGRTAMVYVRQSTPKQLVVHQESTRRQYQLAERAATLGWPQPRIVVVDEDLGRSGTSSEARLGFQRLVSAIGLGEVGLVLVTEVSRLSRLNSDWHRVLELCAVFDTLIADDEGIYDLRDPNDRLVLGLKGTLFAAELHILQARMRAGLLNKARRGALELRLPVGLRRQPDGTVVLDPDEQVQWTLHTLFERFAILKNARAVQRSFQAEGLLMPRFVQDGTDQGHLVWVKPTYQMLTQVLTNPVYAGMFVYGRRVQAIRLIALRTGCLKKSGRSWCLASTPPTSARSSMRATASNCAPICTTSSIATPARRVRARRWSRGWSCVAAVGDACKSNTASKAPVTSVGTTPCAMQLPPANPLANATWMKRCVRASLRR